LDEAARAALHVQHWFLPVFQHDNVWLQTATRPIPPLSTGIAAPFLIS